MKELSDDCIQPHEMAISVRSAGQLECAVRPAALTFRVLSDRVELHVGPLPMSTMHLARGLELYAVALVACDDEVIPLQERIASVADEGDLEHMYYTRHQLLYVACTRP